MVKFYEWQDLEQTGIDEKFSGNYYYNAGWEYTNGDLIYVHGKYAYFSSDGGETWTKYDITDDVADVTETFAGWDDGGDFYIATNKGVLVTSDSGATWARKGDLVGAVYDVFKLGSFMFCRNDVAGTAHFRKYVVGTNTWDSIDTIANIDDSEHGFTIALINSARSIAYFGYYTTSGGDLFRFGNFDGTTYTETWSVTPGGAATLGLSRYSLFKKKRDCSEMFWIFQKPSTTNNFYISTDTGNNFTLDTTITLDLKSMGCMRGNWETESDVIKIFVNYYTGVAQNNIYFYFLDKPDNQQIYFLQDADADLGLSWCDMLFPTEKVLIGNDTTGFEGVGDYYAFGYIDIGSEFIECEIDYRIGKTTFAYIEIYKSFALNRTVVLYNDSDAILFIGSIKQKSREDHAFWYYKCEGYNCELFTSKKTETYTAQIIDVIMRDIIDDECRFGYYDSSIDPDGDFITNRTIDFKNVVLDKTFDTICDFEDAVWYDEPDGKIWCKMFASLTASGFTVNQGTTAYLAGKPEYDLISDKINKVILYGGYVSGVRLKTGAGHGEDLESQRLNGVLEYIDHFPHITDQTQLDNLSDAILARTGMADNPIYIFINLRNLGVPPIGKLVNFQFTPYVDLAVAADYLVQGCYYDVIRDIGEYYLTSGAVQ